MSESLNRLQSVPTSNGAALLSLTEESGESPDSSPLSFSTEQLEHWKDEIAEWWGVEKVRYDHKKTVALFQQWFGVGKKEAVRMEFNSRDKPEQFIEDFLDHVIAVFKSKLHKKRALARIDIDLSFQTGAHATVLFQGQEYKHDVPGHAGLVGKVHYQDGTVQSVFQRFISHPFWQYSHISSGTPNEKATPPA